MLRIFIRFLLIMFITFSLYAYNDAAIAEDTHLIRGISQESSPERYTQIQNFQDYIINLAKKYPHDVLYKGRSNSKQICLTFDDGPDKTVTPLIMDILKQHKIKGTFFVLGDRVDLHKDVIKRMHKEGHIVANHSYSHPRMTKLNNTAVRNELERTQTKIKNVIGVEPVYFRPPYGDIDERIVKMVKGMDMKTVFWSLDSDDWSLRNKDLIAKNILNNIRGDDIILLHCNHDKMFTADAMKEIIPKLKKQGYTFVTLDEILKIPPYKIVYVPVKSVKMNKSNAKVYLGESTTLTATVAPKDATDKAVKWSTNKKSVATVDSKGKVTAVGLGKAVITVTTNDGAKKATCTIEVPYIAPELVTLNRESIPMFTGGVRNRSRLRVNIYPEKTTIKDVWWETDNPDVAIVNSHGMITAVGEGTATITATTKDEGLKASCIITAEDDGILYGDVNDDGVIDIKDAIYILRYVCGLISISSELFPVADVTGDGDVSVIDAIYVLRYIVGL